MFDRGAFSTDIKTSTHYVTGSSQVLLDSRLSFSFIFTPQNAMTRAHSFLVAVVGFLAVATASPITSNNTLIERSSQVTHSGRVCLCPPTILISKYAHFASQATWFNAGLGACGFTDTDSNPIVALSHLIYGSGGNCNQVCPITSPAPLCARNSRHVGNAVDADY